MPANADIQVEIIEESSYKCKNRVTKSNIRMTTFKIIIAGRLHFGYDISCDTHKQVGPQVKNKTEGLSIITKPWLWCYGCAVIHFNTVWQLDPNVRRGTHTHRCNCFLVEED